MNNFFNGIKYAFSGIKKFYRTPHLWRYALIPTVVCLGYVYLLYYVFFHKFYNYLAGNFAVWCEQLWSPLAGVAKFMIGLSLLGGMLLLASVTLLTVFELSGGFFMGRMVLRFETENYHRPQPDLTWREDLRNVCSMIIFSFNTIWISLAFFIGGLFIPVIFTILSILAMSYRYAINYASEAVFNRRIELRNIAGNLSGGRMQLLGFGLTVYFLLLLPFVAVFFLPGFVLGATMLVNESEIATERKKIKLH
ncbi:MAG: EI24 domain-containing protein [Victivallaceae bacterium]